MYLCNVVPTPGLARGLLKLVLSSVFLFLAGPVKSDHDRSKTRQVISPGSSAAPVTAMSAQPSPRMNTAKTCM
ncbi:hypothetical protein RRG08_060956 [Elysia crispata]|uniref:Uncharacterized protein n=1 Tax=Elysia crispata TaxID=231223 RepID=A0AAE1AVT2_9GAST|nr:hypothetical protein RRG08_060956 [Elysia crispata]